MEAPPCAAFHRVSATAALPGFLARPEVGGSVTSNSAHLSARSRTGEENFMSEFLHIAVAVLAFMAVTAITAVIIRVPARREME
jgi:hypothetical protein